MRQLEANLQYHIVYSYNGRFYGHSEEVRHLQRLRSHSLGVRFIRISLQQELAYTGSESDDTKNLVSSNRNREVCFD